MPSFKPLLMGMFVGLLVAFTPACSPPAKKCNPTSCQGCCDSTGACQPGSAPTACGQVGNACQVCLPNQSCSGGLCTAGSTGGGGTGGGTAGGGGGTTGGGGGMAGGGGGTTGGGGGATGGGSGGGSTGGGSGGGSVGGGAGGGTASNDVTGHSLRTSQLGDGGLVITPFNLATLTIGAWITEDGGAVFRAGTGSTNGTFVIPDVPPGPYLLRLQNQYYATSSRVIDFDYTRMGRPDSVAATVDPTSISFLVNDLTPWTVNDSLSLISLNAGAQVSGFDPYLSPVPTPGVTSLSGSTLNYFLYSNAQGTPMIQSSRGDTAWLVQQSFAGDAGAGLVFATRAMEVTNLDMANGQAAVLSGTMTAPPQVTTSYDYRAADFITASTQLNPPTSTPYVSLAMYASPFPLVTSSDAFGEQFRVFAYAPSAPPSPVTWNNPFPSSWNSLGFVAWVSPAARTLGTALPQAYGSQLRTTMSGTAFTTQPIQPRLGPVTQPRINGADLLVDQTGVGLTPTLTWSAPTLGTPRRYVVVIDRLTVVSGATRVAQTFSVDTGSTNLTLPPGWLISGQAYVIRLNAYSTPNVIDPAFFRLELPYSQSSMISGVIRP